MFNNNICIIGGAGHVGAPLGLAFSSKGFNVILLDKNNKHIKQINQSKMPFIEEGCDKLLKKMINKRRIFATNNLNEVKRCKYLVICLGTPVNKKFMLCVFFMDANILEFGLYY